VSRLRQRAALSRYRAIAARFRNADAVVLQSVDRRMVVGRDGEAPGTYMFGGPDRCAQKAVGADKLMSRVASNAIRVVEISRRQTQVFTSWR